MKRLLLVLALAMTAACGPLDTSTYGSTVSSSTSGSDGGCADTWSSYGQSFFSARCSNCHGFTHSAVQGSLSSIENDIASGRMPRGASLSSSEESRVLAYLACGAP